MALLESIIIPLGTKMPKFTLNDPNGKKCSSDKLYGDRGLLVGFFCNHCPYVIPKIDEIKRIAADYTRLKVIGINSNESENYPEDSFEKSCSSFSSISFVIYITF